MVKKKWLLSLKLVEWNHLLIPVILVVLVIVLSILNKHFLSIQNLLNVLQQISILAIVAAGMTFVIIGGGFDLSVGSVVALSGSLASIIMIEQGIFIGVAAGLLVGVLIGGVNGILISRLNISPFIATLGMLVIARGLSLGITGGSAVFDLPSSFSWLGSGKILGIPVPVIVAIIIYLVGIIVLKTTVFGLRVYAVGGNKEASRLSGIAVSRYITATYVICSSCAALAGVTLAARLRAGEPTAGVTMELFAIAAVVLGGTSLRGGEGYLGRTIFGVLFIGLLQNGLNLMNVPYYWQQVVLGVVFIVAACIGMLRSKEN